MIYMRLSQCLCALSLAGLLLACQKQPSSDLAATTYTGSEDINMLYHEDFLYVVSRHALEEISLTLEGESMPLKQVESKNAQLTHAWATYADALIPDQIINVEAMDVNGKRHSLVFSTQAEDSTIGLAMLSGKADWAEEKDFRVTYSYQRVYVRAKSADLGRVKLEHQLTQGEHLYKQENDDGIALYSSKFKANHNFQIALTVNEGSAQALKYYYNIELTKDEAPKLKRTTPNAVAPRVSNIPNRKGYVRVDYDYDVAKANPSANQAVMRMKVIDLAKIQPLNDVLVGLQIHNLKHSKTPELKFQKLAIGEDGWTQISIEGLEAETVYLVTTFFYRDSERKEVLGQSNMNYYTATGGATPLANARRLVAIGAVAEAHDWVYGKFDTRKRYHLNQDVVDGRSWNFNGWCDKFYVWLIKDRFSIRYPADTNGYFPNYQAVYNGSQLPALAARESVMADRGRQVLHTFLILSYDRDYNKVWTVEGNFGNRVQHNQRQVQGGWAIGRLRSDLLRGN